MLRSLMFFSQNPSGWSKRNGGVDLSRKNTVPDFWLNSRFLFPVFMVCSMIPVSLCGLLWGCSMPVFAGERSSFTHETAAQSLDNTGHIPSRTLQSQLGVVVLTEEEKVWLREHPVIRAVQDSGWPPVEFANEKGEYVGMTGDYLTLIEERLGIKFKRMHCSSWQEAYDKLKHWEIDMTPSVALTPERSEFWAFTQPYMKIPIIILTHSDVTYIASMRDLNGRKAAIVEGYAVQDWIPPRLSGN